MFFLPLFDDNPTSSRPYISWAIIAVCIFVYMYQAGLSQGDDYYFILQYGVIPARFFSQFDFLSIVTSLFLHGGFTHLASNMLYLWIFGDNVEDAMGRVRFIVFYLLCGVIAALTQSFIDPSSTIPLIGASGSIAGLLGAYIMLYPRATIKVFSWIIIFVKLINIPAWVVLGIWIGGQFIAVPEALANQGGGVAYFAHIGGFLAGMILVPFFKKKHISLFASASAPQASWRFEPARELRQDIRQRYVLEAQKSSGSVPSFKRRPKGPWDR